MNENITVDERDWWINVHLESYRILDRANVEISIVV